MAYYSDIIVDRSGKTKCELCETYLYDSEIENHLGGKEHTNMFMQRLMIQNNIPVNGKQINCGVCNQVTDVSQIIHHIESNYHKDLIDSIKKLIAKDGGFLILPENITNIGSTVDCLACDRSMVFNDVNIKSHIESARHRRARAIAVQPLNAIFSVENSDDDLWCKICQVYFENYIETIFEHVDEDPEHAKKLSKIYMLIKDQNINIEKFLYDPREDKAYCKKCDTGVACNVDNLERHIKGKRHTLSKYS